MLFPLLALATIVASAPPYIGSKTATINGSKYRVAIRKSGEVVVVSKAILVGRTIGMRDNMRLAVQSTTGCNLVDELWTENTLRGRLDCPD